MSGPAGGAETAPAAVEARAIRRILVALDAATHDLALLDAAALLAARLGSELLGLFVEDLNLMRSAALPFVRQVSLLTAAAQDLDLPTTERELRAMAERAERRIAAAAESQHVKWSFRVVRGHVGREVTAAAEEADLVIVEECERPLSRHLRLPSPCRDAMLQVGRSVLLYRRGAHTEGPIAAVYDGSGEADQALTMAARLAGEDGRELDVLLVAASTGRAGHLEERARARLAGHGGPVTFFTLGYAGLASVGRAARYAGAGLVVLHAASPVAEGADIDALLRDLGTPVLVLR